LPGVLDSIAPGKPRGNGHFRYLGAKEHAWLNNIVCVQCVRTPEERFEGLPGFGYEPRYADVGGLRLAWVEAGPAGFIRSHPAV
jgi:hypothetical protein